jgi:NAD(P)-dependent dehydrogenase (short-subunit alcohol dehydrogenase family)
MSIPAGLGVVVTGGLGDIGLGMAGELLSQGAAVTVVDVYDDQDAEVRLAPLRKVGEVAYRRADVGDAEAVRAALAAVERLDVVIANAAVVESAPFLEITAEQWQRHLDVNLTGCFNTGQAAARLMVDRGVAGRIIFTSSWVQDVPWPEIAAYSVTKSGVKALTRCMAAELARYRILVNAIAPGIVQAGMARHQLETEPQYAARVARAIPLGQLQTVAQVAKAAAFLCSDAADYMTGSTLLVDGGCSLRVVPD